MDAPELAAAPRSPLAERVLVVAFLLGLALPGAGLLAGHGDRDDVGRENRSAAPWPDAPGAEGVARWPAAFSAWLDDSLAFRTALVRLHNALLVLGLDTSPTPRVLLGRDRWMFLGGEDHVDNARRSRPLTADERARWRDVLAARATWARGLGMEPVLLVAPSKSSVYPEQLPARLAPVAERSRLDELLDTLAPVIDVVDVRDALREAKARELVYYPLGSHWTGPGAHRAYEVLVERLRPRVPGLGAPWPRDAFRAEPHDPRGDNWATRLHIGDLVTQDTTTLVPLRAPGVRQLDAAAAGFPARVQLWVNDDDTLPRAVLLHDSFGNALLPFLALHFSAVVAVPHRYVDPAVVRQVVESSDADVLVEEIVEYAFVRAPPPDLRPGAAPGS